MLIALASWPEKLSDAVVNLQFERSLIFKTKVGIRVALDVPAKKYGS